MPAQEDEPIQVGEIVQLVGVAGMEGMRVTVVRNLSKDKWAVNLDGEDKKSKLVSRKNLQKLTSPAGPSKNYSIVGTWDDWDSHEMAWDGARGCFEYTVVMDSSGTESFKFLEDGDWDLCVFPDRNDANPYEDHAVRGPSEPGSDLEWTIGARPEDNAHQGAIYTVCLYVTPDGHPKRVTWQAPGALAGGRAQDAPRENGAPASAPAAQRAAQPAAVPGSVRTSMRDLLKKASSGGSGRREEPTAPAPPPAAPEREAPRRSMSPRSSGPKAAPAVAPPKPLSTVLREARPQASPQELAMSKTKLMQIGIKSAEDLSQALKEGQLQERLKGAGLTTFAPDLVEALADLFGLPARGAASTPRAAPATPRAKSVPKAKGQATLRVPKPKLWQVTGGEETGGVLVRDGPDKSSQALPEKLSCGALVEEIEFVDLRLHYKKRSGEGPARGWILVDLRGKELAKRLPEEEAEPTPAAAAPPAEEEPEARAARAPSQPRSPRAEPARPQEAELPAELRQKAQRLKVPLEKLHDRSPDHVAEFLDRMDRVTKSTATKLQAQYLELGFPVDQDDVVERAEMARLVSSALLWQELQLLPLQEICAEKGLEVRLEQSREELLRLLTNVEWESAGIPIARLPKTEDALAIFSQIRALETSGSSKLAAEAARLDLPTDTPSETMTSQLKQAYIWKALSGQELLRECQAYSLSVTVGDLSQESTREELYQRLVSVMWSSRAEARGVPAKRLGSAKLADQLLASVDRLQVMGPLSLEYEYRKMGVSYDPKMDMQALVDRLRDTLVWEALPMAELQRDCTERGLPAGDSRQMMLQRLRQRLDDELELEAQGLPVRRLGGYEAAMEVLDKYEAIDRLSMEDLTEWYVSTGFPGDAGVTKEDLVKLLKAMAVWEALSLTDLSQECIQNKVDVKDLRSAGGEEAQRDFLVTKLMQQQHMCTWEERGFKAERIGDFETVSELIRRYSKFNSMSDEDLARAHAERGLPCEPGTDRDAMLRNLKMVMVWGALPLFDLQMDCLERSDKIQCDFESKDSEDAQRSKLVGQLTVELLRSAYEHIGVPVEQIGLLEAFSVGKDLVSYTIMNEEELRAECEKMGVAARADMTGTELAARLRDFTLWNVLPVEDLFADCKRRGIAEKLKEEFIGVLLAQQATEALSSGGDL